MRIKLSPAFYYDHISRDLPGGEIVKTTKSYVEVLLTDDEAAELLSDARYYASDGKYMDVSVGLVSSARATVKRLQESGLI